MLATFDQIRPKLVLVCLLLVAVLDQIPLKYTRWVEDESWYSDAGKTLLQEGRLRLSSFPVTDSMGRIDTRPPAMSAALALSFKVFGVGVWQARFPSYAGTVCLHPAGVFPGSAVCGRHGWDHRGRPAIYR